MTTRASLWLQAAALSALVFAVYGNTLRHGLVGYDDVVQLEETRSLFQPGHALYIGTDVLQGTAWDVVMRAVKQMPDRLLRNVSFESDELLAQKSGLPPEFVLHLSNVLLHLLACLLAWQVARRLLPDDRWALFAAALFAAHPLQTESVAYIAGRRDLLLGVFYLAGLAAYIEFRRRSSRRWLALAALCWFLALNSKQNAVTLPLTCWLFDLYQGKVRRRSMRWLAAAGLGLTLPGGLIVLRHVAHNAWTFNGGSLLTHLLTSASIDWHALRLFLWPKALLIAYDRAPFLLVTNPLGAAAWLKAVLLLAAVVWSQTLWKRRPLPAFAAAFFAATFLPTSGLIPWSELFAEHWLYLPLFGLCLAAAWSASVLHRRLSRTRAAEAAPALCAAVLACLAARAVARNRDWKDAETLWTKTAADAPWSVNARFTLGTVYGAEGKDAQAMAQYQDALTLQPNAQDTARIYANMGDIDNKTGRPDKALMVLRQAVTLNPGDYMLNYNLGVLDERSGRRDLAEAAYRKVVAVAPSFYPATTNLAALCFARGALAEAAHFGELAVREKPRDAPSLDNLGVILEIWGRKRRAERNYLLAIRSNKNPVFLNPYFHLAHLYRSEGAEAQAEGVLRSMPVARQ